MDWSFWGAILASALFAVTPAILIGVLFVARRELRWRAYGSDELIDVIWPNGSRSNGVPMGEDDLRHPTAIDAAERKTIVRKSETKRGFGIGSGAVVVSIVLLFVGVIGQAIIRAMMEESPLTDQLVAAGILGGGTVLIGIITTVVAVSAHKEGMQKRLEALSSPYVLYFRPFTFDLSTTSDELAVQSGAFSSQTVNVAFEETLGATCLHLGVGLKAIGKKIEGMYGCDTIASDDENWQSLATGLMPPARNVVVVPAASKGSFWEIQRVIAEPLLPKTIWIMPPRKMAKKFDPGAEWLPVVTACTTQLGMPFPAYAEDGAIFCYARLPDNSFRISVRPYSLQLLTALIRNA